MFRVKCFSFSNFWGEMSPVILIMFSQLVKMLTKLNWVKFWELRTRRHASLSHNLTDKYPGAVFVLSVPGHGLLHPEVGLAFIQFIDQLHLRQWTDNREKVELCCSSTSGTIHKILFSIFNYCCTELTLMKYCSAAETCWRQIFSRFKTTCRNIMIILW